MKKLTEEFAIKQTRQDWPEDYAVFENKDILEKLRYQIIANLIEETSPERSIKKQINEHVKKAVDGYDLKSAEINYLYNLINNEVHGFGPITDLLKDPAVTEIMVNGIHDIYVEIDGQIFKDDSVSFINNNHIIRTIQRIIQPLGRTIDVSRPMVDARLPDGSRLNAIIPPLATKGPVLTIRKFKEEVVTIDDILRNGTVTPYMARFLNAAVLAKLNILVCGGTGSGKTTLLNILSSLIKKDERIVTIEDAAELKLKQEHVVSLETRNKNYEGQGEVKIRNLVINALRMRPDRIIVGEVRGAEAFDMLQAMNTGHDGGITTMHANSPCDALNRLETMVLMAGMEIPVKAVREYIVGALDLVVQVERLSDGHRKVVNISEVEALENETIILKPIFSFTQTGVTSKGDVMGEFVLHDYVPQVYEKIKNRTGENLDEMFGDKDAI